MAKTYMLIAIILVSILLAGCATQTDNASESIPVEKQSMETGSDAKELSDVDIIIVNGQIDPSEIRINNGEVTTLTIHNQMNFTERISIPMYKSDVTANIPANGYEIITLNPTIEGQTAIELNGNRAGFIIVG